MSSTAHLATAPPASGAPLGTGNRWLTITVPSVSLLPVGLGTTVPNVALPALVLAGDPHSAAVPADVAASAQESLGAALAVVARHLPGDAGAAFADGARRAFGGMGPAMATGVGVVVAPVFAPFRAASASFDKDSS